MPAAISLAATWLSTAGIRAGKPQFGGARLPNGLTAGTKRTMIFGETALLDLKVRRAVTQRFATARRVVLRRDTLRLLSVSCSGQTVGSFGSVRTVYIVNTRSGTSLTVFAGA